MADPFVSEIRMYPFNFPPKGWAYCNGQLLPLSQNTALFALLGTVYGGDGKSTFALPDLQGNAALHPGQGSGLSPYTLGQMGGSEQVTLLQSEMPFHTHTLRASTEQGDNRQPTPNMSMALSLGAFAYVGASPALTPMAPQALTPNGASLPHNNMMPYLALNFCIALQGVFPPRP